ncbi:MAG: hypothetical protein JWM78_3720 [Verrucomicrobiaceae bacterium]|nr:hypothetical protein [Verrucomicrobiaceae bacterium]
MKNIFVSGATGFLGGAVIANLLASQSTNNLLLLVRADTAAEGLQRVKENLRTLDVASAALEKLTDADILIGDFTNVAAFSDDSRLDTITHVINCAAITSFGKNPLIWPVNVDGTFEFARRMAEVASLKRFLHVGTAMACGDSQQSPVTESWNVAPADEHLVPYTASKAAIEQRLHEELPDFPLVVARPSIVVGHTQLGCKPSSSIFWVFRMGQLLQQFTCSLDEKIDVIPVDYCADALVKLLLKDELAYDLYHISAGSGSSCTFEDIEIALADGLGQAPFGDNYRQVKEEDIPQLAREFEARLGPCNRRLVMRALRLYAGFADLNYVFGNGRLLSEGVEASPLFTSYAGLCAQSTRHLSIQQQMQCDFK